MFGQDVRFGLRVLRKNPGFTLAAVVALTLGISSATAIFTVVDGVLLRPLPYPDAAQLVTVAQSVRSTGVSMYDSSPANYLDWTTQADVFSHLAASRGNQATLSGGDQPERVRTTTTSSDFFPLFGVSPVLGRTLTKQDATAGNNHVVVLGYDLWQRRFGGQPEVAGRDIILDGQRFTVVGVMPRGFSPDNYGQLWIPSAWDVPPHPLVPTEDPRPMRSRNYLDVWGRLKPGVSVHQARTEMSAIASRLESEYPNDNKDVGIVVAGLHEEAVGSLRSALVVLMAAVAFLLLIGCVNVANLLLARAAARDREIAIRFALGASRGRLVRQLLTESVLLGLIGGAAGVVFAAWGVPLLLALGPADIRNFNGIGLNREVLGFSLAVSILTGLIFGSIPAIYASFLRPNDSLIQAGRGTTAPHHRGRAVLITTEIALSLVLLIGAGLMMKSFDKLLRVDPGFASDHLLVFNVAPVSSTDLPRQAVFYRTVLDRIAGVPGIESVGAVNRLPMAAGNSSRSFMLPGSDKSHEADLRIASPAYFKTMKVPLLRGRVFTEADGNANALPVIVVNEALARAVFPNDDPVGKFIIQGSAANKFQIAGVVGNVRHRRLESAPNPEVYQPLGQNVWPSMFVAVRTSAGNPLTLLPAVQNAVWSVDKNVALADVRTMDDLIANSMASRRFTMLLLTSFAGIALVLAAIGLFGVMSYSVVQRGREIGVRMALGARRIDIFGLIVREGMGLTALGLAIGIIASAGMTRLISNLLFGISATDLSTFAVVSALLAFVAFIACWWPAHRASKVDPIVALRAE
ncbi:MAG: ABC transporter permease [Chthoniobacterales bacterium]